MDKAKNKDLERIVLTVLREGEIIDEDESLEKVKFVAKLQELATTIGDLNSAKKTSARIRIQLSEKQSELEELEERLEEKNEEQQALEKQVTELETEIRLFEDIINQKEEEKREAQVKSLEAQRKMNLLEFEKENLSKSLEGVQHNTLNIAEDNEQQAQEIVALKDRMKALENHLHAIKLKTDQFRKETNTKLEKTNKELKAFSDENTKLKKEITTKQKEAKALNNLTVDTILSGWLHKQSAGDTFGKKIQKRWFVLNGIKLEYFKNEKQDEKPLGTISIDQAKVATLSEDESLKKYGQAFMIELTHDSGKVTTFFAASRQEKRRWVDALKANRMKHIARADRATSIRSLPPAPPASSPPPRPKTPIGASSEKIVLN